MSHIFQSLAAQGWTFAISAGAYTLESLRLNRLTDLHTSSANVAPLTEYPTPFFVRQDRKDSNRKVKIFNGEGNQVYSVERLSSTHPVWALLTFPGRREVATIQVGCTKRSIDFHTMIRLSHRDIVSEYTLANGTLDSFFVDDGIKYSWSRGSKNLEKVINPGAGPDEIRKRVARAKLMRQFKLDFEVLIDENEIDKEVALATSFVSMLSLWGVGNYTDTVGPTYVPPKAQLAATATKEPERNVVVIINNDGQKELTVETA